MLPLYINFLPGSVRYVFLFGHTFALASNVGGHIAFKSVNSDMVSVCKRWRDKVADSKSDYAMENTLKKILLSRALYAIFPLVHLVKMRDASKKYAVFDKKESTTLDKTLLVANS